MVSNDGYLAKKLSEQFPWAHSVYKETSELVHFTSRHIFCLSRSDR